MTGQDVLNYALYNELNQLSFKKAVTESNTAAFLSYLNLGLTEMAKRFDIVTSEVIIDLQDEQTIYALPSDCLKIYEIVAGTGEELPLNDPHRVDSIFTPTPNTIQVPYAMSGMSIGILYKGAFPYISDLTTEFDLPVQLIQPLLSYIGFKAFSALESTSIHDMQKYKQFFEEDCLNVLNYTALPEDTDQSYKFHIRGFC